MKLRPLIAALVLSVFLMPGCKQADIVTTTVEKRPAETPEKKKPKWNLSELLPKAEAGDADAQVTLGIMYYEGFDVTQDYGQAFKWFEKAAAQEIPWAQHMLGQMYQDGQGVERDSAKARMWFKRRNRATKERTPEQKKLAKKIARDLRKQIKENNGKFPQ